MSALEQQSSQAILNSVGALGGKSITGVSAVTPDTGFYFYCIVPSVDMVIAAQSNLSGALNPTITSGTIALHPAGIPIYGKFTSITLTSGYGIGYYARAN